MLAKKNPTTTAFDMILDFALWQCKKKGGSPPPRPSFPSPLPLFLFHRFEKRGRGRKKKNLSIGGHLSFFLLFASRHFSPIQSCYSVICLCIFFWCLSLPLGGGGGGGEAQKVAFPPPSLKSPLGKMLRRVGLSTAFFFLSESCLFLLVILLIIVCTLSEMYTDKTAGGRRLSHRVLQSNF